MYSALYEKIIDELVNTGYVIIDDALDLALAKRLVELAKIDVGFKLGGIAGGTKKKVDRSRRRNKIRWIDAKNKYEAEYLSFTNDLSEYLNRSLFLGLKYYESHFAIYEEGDFYEKHFDAFKNSKNRILTTVYYLNQDWKEENGGELVIYDANDNFLTRVIPRLNTLVLFLSDKFPHEVLPAKVKRYSIAGWYRIDKDEKI